MTEMETEEETPKPKSKKLVNIDGFTFTQEEWDEIKHGYSSEPTFYEMRIAEECKSYIVSALNTIDRTIMTDDYSPESSPDWLKSKAFQFLNLDLTKNAVNNDLVILEQFYEILCGLLTQEKQNIVSEIIDTTIDSIEEKWKETYH